jgi:hypothetical protein
MRGKRAAAEKLRAHLNPRGLAPIAGCPGAKVFNVLSCDHTRPLRFCRELEPSEQSVDGATIGRDWPIGNASGRITTFFPSEAAKINPRTCIAKKLPTDGAPEVNHSLTVFRHQGSTWGRAMTSTIAIVLGFIALLILAIQSMNRRQDR